MSIVESAPLGSPCLEADGRWLIRYGVAAVDVSTAEIQARIRAVLDHLTWVSVERIESQAVEGYYLVTLGILEPVPHELPAEERESFGL